MYEEIIQKIKNLGLDDEKANELFNLLSETVLETLFKDLAENTTDDEMKVFETRIQEAKSPEHFQTIINEIALKTYGDDANKEIKENFDLLINEMQENIKQARELLQGQDPESKALLEKAKQLDISQDITGQQV
jgi:hypothetical protein